MLELWTWGTRKKSTQMKALARLSYHRQNRLIGATSKAHECSAGEAEKGSVQRSALGSDALEGGHCAGARLLDRHALHHSS